MSGASPKGRPCELQPEMPSGEATQVLCNSHLTTMWPGCQTMFAILVFNLALVRFFSIPLFHLYQMGMFILSHCTLGLFNLFLIFIEIHI